MTNQLDEKEVFKTASLLSDPSERSCYLDSACGDDSALRQRVDALLTAHESEDGFLSHGAPVDDLDVDHATNATNLRPGSVVGCYKLLEQIGEGAFGIVYMAEQLEPIQRRVALKIIKAGMDTKQIIARFEGERQALARMDHPFIARVFDAGATETGRPYFVMEMVRGKPITKYCDEHCLPTQDRLQVFLDICAAIEHAHQKGIIHRDIKPGNILVSTDGDRHVSKVIDFGIAKATQGRLTDKTAFTQFRQFMGTPAYMSPEQTQMSSADIDTRSDIYSLGALLYELLTGNTPLDAENSQPNSMDDICRRIREEEPAKPSTRLGMLTHAQRRGIAEQRNTEPDSLGKTIRGELDWIVMKAIEKDRTRRYETTSALANDVQRYMANEPVVAGPPTIAYRLRKFTSRNRLVVLATTLVAVALIAGTLASSLGLVQARRAQHHLEKTQGQLRNQLLATNVAREQAEMNLYVAQMNRAATAYQEGSLSLALSLLKHHQDSHGDRFEWRLIHHLCQRGDALHTFRDHIDRVNTLAISQHGLIASGGADRTFRLYDLNRKREIASKTMPSDVIDLDFTPDGDVLAVASKNNEVTFWNVDTLEMIGELPKNRLTNNRPGSLKLEFLSDGSTLAVTHTRSPTPLSLWEWQAPTKSPVVLKEADGSCLSFAPSGNLLVLGGPAQRFGLWRRTPEGTFKKSADVPLAHLWGLSNAVFSLPDGRYLASTDESSQIRIWETKSIERAEIANQAKRPQTILRTSAKSLAYSPDGQFLASGGRKGNRNVEVWRGRPPWKDQPVSILRGHTGDITSIGYSHDGRWIVTSSADHTVKLWPGSVPAIGRDTMMANDWVFSLEFSPDNRKLAAAGFDGHIMVFDVETREELLNEKRHNHEAFDVAFSADGQWLASCSGRWRYDGTKRKETMGRVSLVNLIDREKDYYVDGLSAEVRGIDLSPQGKQLAIAELNGTVRIWDVEQRATLVQVDTSKRNRRLHYSPDGQLLAVATLNGLELRRSQSLELVASFGNHYSPAVAFSPDGKALAYGVDEQILLLRTPELTQLEILETAARIWNVAFLPDGKTLAACELDGSVRLWNLETRRDVVSLPAHQDNATGLAVSHDNMMMASSGADKAIHIWRANPPGTQ